jgi:hypothetical protein
MRETFAEAKRRDAAAILLVIQANPGFDASDPTRAPTRDPATLAPEDGFANFLRALREETIAFRRPVVLAHGDSHYFRVDTAARLPGAAARELHPARDARRHRRERQQRRGVGEGDGGRCREVFSFQPQIVPGNRVAVPAP